MTNLVAVEGLSMWRHQVSAVNALAQYELAGLLHFPKKLCLYL